MMDGQKIEDIYNWPLFFPNSTRASRISKLNSTNHPVLLYLQKISFQVFYYIGQVNQEFGPLLLFQSYCKLVILNALKAFSRLSDRYE